MPKGVRWKMEKPCDDCPFNASGPGAHLRKSLRPGRFASIKRDLLRGNTFMCHKTTEECGNGHNLFCAGALAFQERNGVSSNYQRVCESLDYFREQREKKLERSSGA